MKNLKKLSVVLFATLLSFNFTSCIEDGVSDAVDQVYLAQAEFLRAQATLKEAEAQEALARAVYDEARAAYELARAEVQLADARYTDAETDGVILDNEAQAQQNIFDAQEDLQLLAEMEAKLEVVLQEQLTLLAEAQSAHDVAMVNLGEAVAQAKDVLILEYYADYSVVISELQGLYADKIQDEHDLAIKELMLVDVNATDLVSRAYYQAMLEADLAESEAMLVAKNAALDAAMLITADDASDAQKWVTDLYNQAQAIIATNSDLRVEREQASIAVDQAWEEWLAASDQYAELMLAGQLLEAAEDALEEHLDEIEAAEDAIADAEANIAAIPAAEAALAAVDTTTAYNGITAAMDAIDAAEDARDDAVDLMDAAEDVYNDAMDARVDAEYYAASIINTEFPDPNFPILPRIVVLEAEYGAALAALAAYSPLLTVADAEIALAAADAAEQAAQAAWSADPTGNTTTDTDGNHSDFYYGVEDFDLGEIGDDTDLAPDTYMRVATWIEYPSPGSGNYRPATFYPTQYNSADLLVEGAALVADLGNGIGSNADVWLWEDTPGAMLLTDLDANVLNADDHFFTGTQAGDAALNNIAVFVNVELDDDSTTNIQVLVDARFAAAQAQSDLIGAVGGLQAVQDVVDDALEAVTEAYAAFGFTFPDTDGVVDVSDVYALTLYWEGLVAAEAVAYEAWNNSGTPYEAYPAPSYDADDKASALGLVYDAEEAVADAEAALGTDFRPGDTDDKAWTNEFSLWYDLYEAGPNTIPTNGVYTETTYYQQLKDEVAEGVIQFVRYPRHEGTSISAYQALENAYYEVVWAMEDLEALGTVASNEDDIEDAMDDIAEATALIPSHEYAVADVQARFDALMAEFGFDLTLWDLEGGHGLPYMLADLPLYAAYLDAIQAESDIQAVIDANFAMRMDIVQLRQSVVDNLIDDVTLRNVDQFMADVADQIEGLEGDIEDLEADIENETALVAIGIIDTDTAAAWIAECERQLEVLNTKIEGFETAAASLLARINALLN